MSIHEEERKKSKVDTSINILGKEADDLAKSAEAKHDFTLLTKSNALRLKVAQQSQEIPMLEKELKELKEKLKSLESTVLYIVRHFHLFVKKRRRSYVA